MKIVGKTNNSNSINIDNTKAINKEKNSFNSSVILNRVSDFLQTFDYSQSKLIDHTVLYQAGEEIDEQMPSISNSPYFVNWEGLENRINQLQNMDRYDSYILNIEPYSPALDFTKDPEDILLRSEITEVYNYMKTILNFTQSLNANVRGFYNQMPLFLMKPYDDSKILREKALDNLQWHLLGAPNCIFKDIYLQSFSLLNRISDEEKRIRDERVLDRARSIRNLFKVKIETFIRPTRVGDLNSGVLHTKDEIRDMVKFSKDQECNGAVFWCDGGVGRISYNTFFPLIDVFLNECNR